MSRRAKNRPIVKTKEERLLETYELLAQFRQIDHKTIAECSSLLRVSERTVNNYLKDERYQQTVDRLRSQWREDGITTMGNLVRTALDTLLDVMENDKSGHARFEAAAKVLELYGVQVLPEQQNIQDDSAELDRLTRLLASRPTTVNIYQTPPEPGGGLPKEVRGEVVESEFLPAGQLKQLTAPEVTEDPFDRWVKGLG